MRPSSGNLLGFQCLPCAPDVDVDLEYITKLLCTLGASLNMLVITQENTLLSYYCYYYYFISPRQMNSFIFVQIQLNCRFLGWNRTETAGFK